MKLRHAVTIAALSSLAGLASLPGCSSDESSASSGGLSSGGTSSGGTTGESISVAVSAATGGTVSDKAGSVSLAIPPGALDKDTTITLQVGAQTSATIASVYDFGPDGLKFLKPVSLQIKASVPAGKSAAIAYESSGAWKSLSDTVVDKATGMAKASTDHFTKYSVVLVDGQAVLEPPATCAQAAAEFAACGGDPQGTWAFAEFCVGSAGGDPFGGKCPSGTATMELTSTRVVTIDATTITNSAGTETSRTTLNVPDSCLSANGVTCAQVTDETAGRTCTDATAVCICSSSEVKEKAQSQQTYTITGNTITMKDPEGSTSTGEFCVKQNLLYFREIGGNGVLYVLNRK